MSFLYNFRELLAILKFLILLKLKALIITNLLLPQALSLPWSRLTQKRMSWLWAWLAQIHQHISPIKKPGHVYYCPGLWSTVPELGQEGGVGRKALSKTCSGGMRPWASHLISAPACTWLLSAVLICKLPPNCRNYIEKHMKRIPLHKNFRCYWDIGVMLKRSGRTTKSRKKQEVTDENHKMTEMFMIGFQREETYKKVWVYGS